MVQLTGHETYHVPVFLLYQGKPQSLLWLSANPSAHRGMEFWDLDSLSHIESSTDFDSTCFSESYPIGDADQ